MEALAENSFFCEKPEAPATVILRASFEFHGLLLNFMGLSLREEFENFGGDVGTEVWLAAFYHLIQVQNMTLETELCPISNIIF